ncbi:MAG: fumarylacetoacetate hydrolase family protein [Desulfobacteraceae bacterium]|nr:fumarylacetoacetate hydrolase family protein [Desulfobacteraceae bacterium]
MQVIRFTDPRGEVRTGYDFNGKTAALISGDLFDAPTMTNDRIEVKQLLAPITPAAIICIGLNYRQHAEETGLALPRYPVVFMKNPGAVTGPASDIIIPGCCAQPPEVDYEAELAVVIGKAAKNVQPDQALSHVFGYCCANDVSARRWQKHAGGNQWVRGKSFDTFCPLGPFLVTGKEIGSPQDLEIECRLNSRVMQKSSTSDMIFSVAEIVSFLSEGTTLMPGTVILTGTPSGVGFTRTPPVFLKPGDLLETHIQGLGTLTNRITGDA